MVVSTRPRYKYKCVACVLLCELCMDFFLFPAAPSRPAFYTRAMANGGSTPTDKVWPRSIPTQQTENSRPFYSPPLPCRLFVMPTSMQSPLRIAPPALALVHPRCAMGRLLTGMKQHVLSAFLSSIFVISLPFFPLPARSPRRACLWGLHSVSFAAYSVSSCVLYSRAAELQQGKR